jgi:hypothetical protein
VACPSALGVLPDDQQMLYFILIESAFGDVARKAFEMLPEAEKIVEKFISERQQRSFDKGRAAEKAAAVIEVLDARGLVVTDAERERILGCKELERIRQRLGHSRDPIGPGDSPWREVSRGTVTKSQHICADL